MYAVFSEMDDNKEHISSAFEKIKSDSKTLICLGKYAFLYPDNKLLFRLFEFYVDNFDDIAYSAFMCIIQKLVFSSTMKHILYLF